MTLLPPDRSVTVSIVSHGQWALAAPLLAQLQAWCAPWIDKVVLTLNIPEQLSADLPLADRLVRIDNPAPRGFGANHNAAFAHCDSEWFLVLNPDIRLDSDVLAPLLAAAPARAGLVTPRIMEPGKPGPEPFRRLLTPLELWQRRRQGHVPPTQPDWVAGMFMLLRREAFAEVHGFDQRYHMYCEDFDLCARLRLAGWGLHVAHQEQVLHDAQRASNNSLRPLVWHLASFIRVWSSRAFWRYRRLLAARA